MSAARSLGAFDGVCLVGCGVDGDALVGLIGDCWGKDVGK